MWHGASLKRYLVIRVGAAVGGSDFPLSVNMAQAGREKSHSVCWIKCT